MLDSINSSPPPTQVHLYGLYLDLYLWDQPHYRAKTYRHDLLAVRAWIAHSIRCTSPC